MPDRIEDDSLLLVLPVPFRRDDRGRLAFEAQACNGLERWAEHFSRLIVACPTLPGASAAASSAEYRDLDALPSRDRIEPMPLPWAYALRTFLKELRPTRARLAEAIGRSRFLSFAIGGLVGDWPSVAALEAIKRGRRYSIWTDRVEHRVVRRSHLDASGPKRLVRRVKNGWVVSPLMARLERHLIARCDLGLFHGRDCFDAYAPICREPHLVHNIHLKPEDRIGPDALRAKADRARSGATLRLCYAGRVAAMKGPDDWVRVMAALRDRGIDLRASWYGDGPLLEQARARVGALGLADRVDFPGFVGDQARLLESLRDADLFVFCHKTAESPRCLIEALMSGTPIVGYDASYPRDLLGDAADRLLVPRDDPEALADRVAALDADRDALASLMAEADDRGAAFSDEAVFRHRSELIKLHLRSDPASPGGRSGAVR